MQNKKREEVHVWSGIYRHTGPIWKSPVAHPTQFQGENYAPSPPPPLPDEPSKVLSVNISFIEDLTICMTTNIMLNSAISRFFFSLHFLPQHFRLTSQYGTPTMFIDMLNHPNFSQYDMSSLSTGIMAGSPCPIETMKQTRARMNMSDVCVSPAKLIWIILPYPNVNKHRMFSPCLSHCEKNITGGLRMEWNPRPSLLDRPHTAKDHDDDKCKASITIFQIFTSFFVVAFSTTTS